MRRFAVRFTLFTNEDWLNDLYAALPEEEVETEFENALEEAIKLLEKQLKEKISLTTISEDAGSVGAEFTDYLTEADMEKLVRFIKTHDTTNDGIIDFGSKYFTAGDFHAEEILDLVYVG